MNKLNRILITAIVIVIANHSYSQTVNNDYYNVISGTGKGIRFWSNDAYKIHMGNTAEYKYGPVQDYSIKTNMVANYPNRGWTWGVSGATPVAAIAADGRMQIAKSLGIGKPVSDGVLLDVNGMGRFGADGNAQLYLATDGMGSYIFSNAMGPSDLIVYSKSFSVNNWNTDLFKVKEDGNIGIGIGNPTSKLHLRDGDFKIGGQYKQFVIHTQFWSSTSNGLFFIPENNGALDSDKQMVLRDNGNLEVNGTIYTKKIVVKLPPFPDYVFSRKYNLMSINELDCFIEQNSHLPNIPSAKDIETEGIGVGELQIKMMEKIEELTLYIIQMNKEMEVLKAQIKVGK